MNKLKKYYILFWLLIVICAINSRAQSPNIGTNVNDRHWVKQEPQSDDFDVTALDSKWCKLDPSAPLTCRGYNWGSDSDGSYGNTFFRPDNVSTGVYDGTRQVLKLRADGPKIGGVDFTGTYPLNYSDTAKYWTFSECCKTGGIKSVEGNTWQYGYIEIEAKLPGFSINGIGYANKFWPAFWTYSNYNCGGITDKGQDEIDIMDECCSFYRNAKTTGAGWGHNDINNCNGTNPPWGWHINSTPLCDDYHKIAAEWNADKIVFYMDDIPWNYTSIQGFTMNPQRILIDLQIDARASDNGKNYDFAPGTIFSPPPHTGPDNTSMLVDHFYYWKLNLDCSNSLTILNNTELNNYWNGTPAVKSDITLGNSSSIIAVGTGSTYSNFVFRAVNTISVNGDFTLPSGIEFTMMPTPCN
ncbi:MAG: family 16 glycosylhydrolase [Bacteroidetes bacterium]|nr:family 16 glycosylhydrolase [Bacteroidota bacterium]